MNKFSKTRLLGSYLQRASASTALRLKLTNHDLYAASRFAIAHLPLIPRIVALAVFHGYGGTVAAVRS
jgi:hypothetical protein